MSSRHDHNAWQIATRGNSNKIKKKNLYKYKSSFLHSNLDWFRHYYFPAFELEIYDFLLLSPVWHTSLRTETVTTIGKQWNNTISFLSLFISKEMFFCVERFERWERLGHYNEAIKANRAQLRGNRELQRIKQKKEIHPKKKKKHTKERIMNLNKIDSIMR